MAVVDLELFKKHVRADDFADDDVYLQHLLDVAEETVITATHRTEYELKYIGVGTIPKPLIHAMMMVAAHWYNQRESVSMSQMYQVPETLSALIKPFRKLVEDTE